MRGPRAVRIVLATLILTVWSAGNVRAAGLNVPADPRYLDGWRMAGANPERASRVPEDVPGVLQLEWYRPFEAFISHKVHVIAADGMLFVATARGVYALDAESGDEKWVYPTELPLGDSPTVVDGVAYVGCFDRRYIDKVAPDIPEWLRKRPNDLYGVHCDPNPPIPYQYAKAFGKAAELHGRLRPIEELVKYLDVPAFLRGDLYYIDNLCAALAAARP